MYQNSNVFYSSAPLPRLYNNTNQYGNQMYTTNPQTVQMNFAYRNEYARQQRALALKTIEENYPFKFVFVYSCLIIIIGIVQIALQIAIIANNGYFSVIGNGIWGGVICLVLGVLALSLIKWKNYCLLITTYIFHTSSIVILIFAFIMINAISIFFYSSGYYTYNKSILPLVIIMMVLGLVAVGLVISYLAMMCKINTNRHRIVNYNTGAPVYLNNLQYPVNYERNMY